MEKIMTTRNTALEPNDDLTRANGRFGSSQVFLGLKAMFMAAMLLMSVVAMAQQQPTGVVVKGHVFGGGNEGPVLSDAEVSIAAGTVEKDVYGGGNLADVSGSVTVTMTGGTVNKDVYGGGALANTNTDNRNVNGYVVATALNEGESITDLYERSGAGTAENPYKYTKITDSGTTFSSGTYYRQEATWAHDEGSAYYKTTVDLTGGLIKGDAYGGGLGRLGKKGTAAVNYTQEEAEAYNTEHNLTSGDDGYVTTETVKTPAVAAVAAVEAKVFGDVTLNLGGAGSDVKATEIQKSYYTGDHAGVVKSGRVFGCNNLNGSPQGNVTVNIYKTTTYNSEGDVKGKPTVNENDYEVAAVYGGGNLSNYEPVSTESTEKKTKVIIHTCDVSVESVYGGGNAAAVPETDVTVNGAYEIQYVFGGGNGKDPYTLDGGTNWINNAGADVGGNTKVLLQDGYIHEAYGGSNEKGTVSGTASLNTGKTEKADPCGLNVIKLVGAGKNADIDGDAILVLGCMPEAKVDEIYGGADNANVNGNVELTITSGNFGKVFGGNNRGGLIKGHIILNIEETSCRAINIDELYLGGNEAAYSIYGYYDSGETDQETNKPIYLPRVSENDSHTAVDNPSNADGKHPFPYADPILNVISCTRIGRVFGGGYGEGAALYGNPTVNLNMIPGAFATDIDRDNDGTKDNETHRLGEIGGKYRNANNEEVDGGVFGGGDGAAVYGNTTVNIGTATTVQMTSVRDEEGELLPTQPTRNVEGAYINCNVYGGGNEANVYGNTQVNICAIDDPSTTDVDYSSVTINGSGYEGVTIKGDVFGGGKGIADNFFCNKAMVGEDGAGANADKYPDGYPDGNTNVIIGNGTVEGTVYGGGEIGRVEMNTTVTIGLQKETSSPTIKGNVFGAGKGLETHGYAALVRGNPTVTVQGHAKVEQNVYGGGEIASVARYKLVEESDLNKPEFVAAHPGLGVGMPYALAKINGVNTGNCTVIVRDNAEVGTEQDGGNVFGAGQGILPYYDNSNEDKSKRSRRMMAYNSNTYNESNTNWEFADDAHQNVWEYFPTEAKYIEFVQTQGLSSQTNVTISGNATVRGSLYGGSENGIVQFDAHVNVTGGTIGVGQKGGVTFGNVFGAGKGYVDTTRPENLLAGIVRGNTEVTITDGSILHNVYGGGAYGSVGTITPGSVTYVPGQTSVSNMPVSWARKTESETSYDTGTATIKITGGTIGVDGHEDGMVFGSSRGDVGAPGSILDHQAWVYEAHVIIGDSEHPGNTTTPVIRGSIYGSGENGHVFKNAVVDIHGGTIGLTTAQSTDPEGYTGADYLYRGNVYGGGCGTDKYYSDPSLITGTHTATDGEGDKYNALSGCVLGNATVNIDGGHVVHNVYGAGAMGSVGRTDINNNVPTTTGGKTMITITGGRIGDDGVGDGNVYGAARGGEGISDDLAHVRETEVTIQYSTTPNADNDGRTEQLIAGSVFGGGESGTVQENVVVNVEGGLILHDVYGGGALANTQTSNWDATNSTWTDATNKSSVNTTLVNLKGGRIIGDLYGGGLGRKDDTQAVPAVTAVEAKVYGDVTVTTTGGKAARVFGCNNLNGAPQGRVAVNINGTDPDPDELDDTNYLIGNVYGGGNQAAYNYVDHPLTVTMAGGIVNNVFGGGLSADVAGSIAVNVTGGQVINDVYGGGALANTNTANWTDPSGGVEYVDITSSLAAPTYQEKQVKVGDSVSNLYIKVDNQYQQASGTAQSGVTYYELARPSVAGYYLRSDTTEPFTYTLITTSDRAVDNTNYYQKKVVGSWSDGMNGDNGTTYKTTVDLTGGIVGNAYGGGLGDADHAANVYGDVRVTINAPDKLIERLGNVDVEELAKNGGEGVAFTQRPTKFTIGSSTTEHTISVTGHVFGCNNINGTPTGDVAVYVYSTRQLNDNGEIISGHTPAEIKNENEKYEIQGVYGGGNLADYMPAADKKTIVRIDGCNVTSIKKVFGGGNSALVPATDVIITGSHAIGYAFGGGNGGDFIKKNGVWQENEGAIVIGTASIACHGGSVGSVFGGSDAKGVCGGTHIDTTADTGEGACSLKITRIYGAGNEADVNGNVNTIISVCASDEVKFVHGGSYNAHITGNVTLTITSGILQNVYGGNDARGSIGGNITVNIEETETSCNTPIIIQNLVGGGNNAPYPGTNRAGVDLAQNNNWHGEITVNVKSATRIDNVYGGCFNAQANADTEVNINMVKGRMAGYQYEVSIPKRYYDSKNSKTTIPNITYQSSVDDDYIKCTINDEIGTIGNVYGGGKEGKVVGNTTVNIGTATTVPIMKRNDQGKILEKKIVNNEEVESVLDYSNGQNIGNAVIAMTDENVLGAHITDSIYGGGELADVTGNTFVNICAQYNETSEKWESVPFGTQAVTIGGNVYGGGKGKADTFTCEKAMVGIDGEGAIDANNDGEPDNPNGGTTVRIGNGTVEGNVYGGGEIARVEKNSDVTIGFGAGVSSGTPTSAPEIKGDVFGAGKGVATHGYSALLRGNPSVTVQGNAKVGGSVYGGGEIASVARYKVAKTEAEAAAHGVSIDMPYTLANSTSGNCKVVVQGYAEIGPDGMQMTKSGGPDFSGNVFGAGKGILPGVYTYSNNDNKPRRMVSDNGKNSWQYFASEEAYLSFVQTLALSSYTDVTIDENAFVKGSVYGGSENGIVQYDTHVKIKGGQIGCGTGQTTPYSDWSLPSLPECDHWPYGEATADADKYAPYDNFAGTTGYDSRGGRTTGDDGHTYYGNVFGGGSGKDPYAPGKWHREAGIVRGNTKVDITGGHILTNVYGGNEMTDVAGKCIVNFGGTATLGVPRTLKQIADHPVTCYLFGAGKGDPRTFFNTWTNIREAEVNITGGRIYGSIFGGGEDGHVLENVTLKISGDAQIGTTGTSYVDGNVFGGGRGFSGEALTAGSIGGNVTMDISGGTILGSVYGGGRMASVGIDFTDPDDDYYGQLKDDVDAVLYTEEDQVENSAHIAGTEKTAAKTYGHVTMNITGGTIGNSSLTGNEDGAEHSGNVFGGSMGRITLLNGAVNPLWPKLAVAKITSVNISDGAVIMNNVYGGGEYGIVRNLATVTVSGGTVNGNVFGGGYGSDDNQTTTTITPAGYAGTYYTFIPILWAGCVSGNTNVIVSGGEVKKNVYGGGELASVGLIDFVSDAAGKFTNMPKHTDLTNSFGLSWPYEFHYHAADPKDTSKDGKATVTITGNSKIGTDNDNNTGYVYGGGKGKVAFGTTDDIDEQRYTEAFCANVRETAVTIGTTSGNEQPTIRTVYGGGEDGHVYENATVIINNGTIGNSVFGGGKGTSTYQTTLRKVNPNYPDDSSKDFDSDQTAHSWTAGRVYGNTTVTMNGGSVKWFIYGGGNLGSVGVGNYSGGPDDYSTVGYGELPSENGNLWTTTSTAESETKDDAYHFLNSGIATVNLFGGTVGTGSGTDEYGIPHGSVFGGSRGQAAASCKRSPRYKYVPDFFLGYVNKAIINIGKKSDDFTGDYAAYEGPTIYGSVYGGGQDGHVRNSTEVKIYKGEIQGLTSDDMGRSGNVFGAGSGIGTYMDGAVNKVNNSSGSVTCTTLVEVNGGTIKGSIYGGGALASVGPPKTGGANPNQTYDEKNTPSGDWKSYSYSQVNIKGGSIGGNVFAASRGPGDKYLATNPHFDTTDGKYDATKYATDIWSNVHVSGGKIGYDSNGAVVADGGSVYGGGETGQVKCDVTVNITGGEIAKDVYGGGALAHTNTSVWKQKTSNEWGWTDETKKTAKYTTTVNLLGGIIHGDAYGGGLGRKEYGTSGQDGYVAPVEALVYGDVKVNLNGLESEDYVESIHDATTEPVYGGHQVKDDVKGAIVNRVFGCNNLNGSPQGKVRVHVFATQNEAATQIANTPAVAASGSTPAVDAVTTAKVAGRYDVAAVYGGANLAAYTPMGPKAHDATKEVDSKTIHYIDDDHKNTEQRSEVIIDGCSRTSIQQVYGGGNAAPAPATYVEVNGTYEIDEVFGGGNGADNYTLMEGNIPVWYQNPGANVGYKNYTHNVASGTSPGTENSPYYLAVEDDDFNTKEKRMTDAAAAIIRYGSGIATTAIKGGKIHKVYGGSNQNGNISTTALSMYESMNDECPIDVDESYGGSKDAIIDGEIVTRSQCAHGVKELFGGSKNANVNNDIVLTITNGSSYERVFGGNNTSGAINGSITVNIEEGGCEPIKIQELYAGGYLAPYSVYGYETNDDGTYKTQQVAYLDENNEIQYQTQCIPLTSGDNPKKDPRINVISATQIDNIFGGGYQAKLVGNPHINVNMTKGKVEVENKGTGSVPEYKDADGTSYETVSTEYTYYATVNDVKTEVQRVEMTSDIESQLPTTDTGDYKVTEDGKTYVYRNGNNFYKVSTVTSAEKYWTTLDIGSIGNIYGGGNLADIVGDTYVEIGTGKWLTWDASGNPVWETTDASGNTYTSSQTSAAVTYTQAECNAHNAALRGYIPSGVKLTVDKASAVNTVLGTTYVTDNEIYTEDAAAYNATLPGFWTTSTVKTAATGTAPAEYYTQAECNEHNATLNGYIASTTTLTAKQVVAVKETVGTNYTAGATISTEDAAAYNATLNGHLTTSDVKTPAVWTWYNAGDEAQVQAPVPARNAAKITGNVFGGGKGAADTFTCEKAMVGVDGDGVAHPEGGTHVTIANGTVGTLDANDKLVEGTGNVYGGGEIARVEKNTMVTIGVEANDAPVIYGDVFGAGKGVETHGYSALVRGNPSVIIQGKSQVRGSVYGGGEIASVARYKVVNGSPVALANKTSGNCKVIIRGDAEIGPDNMKMKAEGGPDDTGHVFGAGKGVLPGVYSYTDNAHRPRRMLANNQIKDGMTTVPVENDPNNSWQYFVNDEEYHAFIETLALSSKTDVTIGGNAFVKGSVYGGSLSGIVQYDTHVTIEGDCQIGNGDGVNRRYTTDEWAYDGSTTEKSLSECASWDYVDTEGAPHDPFATTAGVYDYTNWSIPDKDKRDSSDKGKPIATDGHTYYGNVFGGGSGVIPYAPGLWHRAAGTVRGNTVVDITGGHILTSIYGGNEHTDVGIYSKDSDGKPTVPVSGGLCTINFGGTATLGVPRTVEQIKAHPVTCYIFGAGKGDQRIFFNTWTNIREAEVNITGGRIYGSVFGGGEDGHVIEDVTVNISDNAMIGTTGTSYVDGNVFGAGRGFSGEALTAGSVGGNVEVNITGGTMLGSIYGGGRLASVGIGFNAADNAQYGSFTDDVRYTDADQTAGSIPEGKEIGDVKEYKHGHVKVNISGGTIGNDKESLLEVEHTKGGNVFGGSMGRLELLDGVKPNPMWPQLGQVKTTTVSISGDALIKSNVYGGGELGTVRDKTDVNISGGTVNRDVYGGGYGSKKIDEPYNAIINTVDQNANPVSLGFKPMMWAGCVGQGTNVNISGGRVKKSVYGGGEMASVGIFNYKLGTWRETEEAALADGNVVFKNPETNKYAAYANIVKHEENEDGTATKGFALSWPYEFSYMPGYEGKANVTITGGRIGLLYSTEDGENNPFADKDNGDVYGGGKGEAMDRYTEAFLANVGSAEITIDFPSGEGASTTLDPVNYKNNGDCIAGAVYGGGENGHVMGDTKVTLTNGLIGHSLYGGGSGKGKYDQSILKIGAKPISENPTTYAESSYYQTKLYSITSGKVYGNANVTMTGGYVVRHVYGGGNTGSVGKGNYAGGIDDFSYYVSGENTYCGFGEALNGNSAEADRTLWDGGNANSLAFLNSGKCTVTITGGTVGYVDPSNAEDYVKDGLPYGSVFGGCRGECAPNIRETPRYLYSPEFFTGYVNETEVIIGDPDKINETDYTGPTIFGSVYGGGQDGHVRRDTHVIINKGKIGKPYSTEYLKDKNKNYITDLDDPQWLHRGNVYGAGSGIGKYKYDFDYDGDYDSNNNGNGTRYNGKDIKEEDFSTSAGSVTRFTKVEVKGGTIHRNVYGGGSLSSVGPPIIPPTRPDDADKKGDTTEGHGPGRQSLCEVIISSKIGTPTDYQKHYGGEVYGASRGNIDLGASYGSTVWTQVKILDGADIPGNVFGGGDNGVVKKDAEVFIGEKKVVTSDTDADPEP